MHGETLDLREVMVFLAAAGLVVPLVRRLGVSPVLGFLGVGLLIGPYGLARFSESAPWISHIVISDLAGVQALAELGVVFLLFMIGLELSLARLWAMRRLVFGLGSAQVVLSGIVIAAIAAAFGNSLSVAIVLGAAFALSSTAIVMQLLVENRRLGTPTGQTAFAVLLLQDLAVLPILLLVGGLATSAAGSPLLAFASAMALAAAAVSVILVIGRLVIRPLFRLVGGAASREMFLALVLLIIIGTAAATQGIGMSMALGAFLAGLLFSETEYRHQIEVDIEPFKGLLLGLFFVSVGMGLDLATLTREPALLLASVVGLFVVKGVIIYGLVRLFGEPRAVATEAALLLGQGGEFAFIVIALAATLGLMPTETAQFMGLVTGLTMVATPFLAGLARRWAGAIEATAAGKVQPTDGVAGTLSGHVIVVGYGRVGQLLGSLLEAQQVPHVGIDSDTVHVASFRQKGACVFYGDASQTQLLERLGAGRAAALVVTMNSPHATERVVEAARHQWPKLPIYARAHDARRARELIANGASHVVPETMEASLQLGEMVLTGVGIPEEAARHLVEVRRKAERAALDGAAVP